MPKKIFISLTTIALLLGIATAAPMQRVISGWGNKASVTTTPTAVTVKQPNATPDTGYIESVVLENIGTGEVHVAFNVSLGTFTNMYASNICMVIASGDKVDLPAVPNGSPVWKITHRTATGTATLHINGR